MGLEVAGGHAGGEGFDHGAAGGAGGEECEGFVAVEAGAFDEGECFGEGDELDAAEVVVDEFEECALPEGPRGSWASRPMAREEGLARLEGLFGAADEEEEFAVGGVGFGAGDGCVEEVAVFLLCGGGEFADPGGGDGAGFDEEGVGAEEGCEVPRCRRARGCCEASSSASTNGEDDVGV